jgi:hypothetical protein
VGLRLAFAVLSHFVGSFVVVGMSAWVVQTSAGEEAVITALTDPDYTLLSLTLPSDAVVPVVPLWEDIDRVSLAFPLPAEVAPWLPSVLVPLAARDDRSTVASDGFCVAVVAVVASLVQTPLAFNAAPSGFGFTEEA